MGWKKQVTRLYVYEWTVAKLKLGAFFINLVNKSMMVEEACDHQWRRGEVVYLIYGKVIINVVRLQHVSYWTKSPPL